MMRAWTLISCLVVAAQGARLAAEERLRDFHVLGIGAYSYAAGSAIPAPADPASDVYQMADYFASQDFDSGKPRREPRMVVNEKATTKAIERQLADLPNWVGRRATVVIIFSGHGTRRAGNWYFLSYDADLARIEDSCLSGQTLMRHVDALIAQKHCRVLLVLCPCYAGQILTAAEPLLDKYRDPDQGGLILLASCMPSQVSYGSHAGGKFSTVLMQGMKMMLAHVRPTSSVSIKELRRFLRAELPGHLRFGTWKAPGIEWQEQYCMIEYSLSIPEDLGLTWADPKFVVPVKNWGDAAGAPPPGVKVIATDASPVGSWRCDHPLVKKFKPVTNEPEEYYRDEKGRLIVEKIFLQLNKDGTYDAGYIDYSGAKQLGAGSFRFRPGAEFSLIYETGMDSYSVDKLDANEMVLRSPNQIIVSTDLMAQVGLSTAWLDPVFKFVRLKKLPE